MFSKENPSPGNFTGKAANKYEQAHRVAKVYDWILSGVSGPNITARIMDEFKISKTQALNIRRRAFGLFEKEVVKHANETNRDIALARYHLVYQEALSQKKLKEALIALKEISKMEGVDPELNIKGGINGAKQISISISPLQLPQAATEKNITPEPKAIDIQSGTPPTS